MHINVYLLFVYYFFFWGGVRRGFILAATTANIRLFDKHPTALKIVIAKWKSCSTD